MEYELQILHKILTNLSQTSGLRRLIITCLDRKIITQLKKPCTVDIFHSSNILPLCASSFILSYAQNLASFCCNCMFSKLVTTLLWNLPFKNIGSSVVSLAEVVSSSVALPAQLVAPLGHVIQPINHFLTLTPTAYQILWLPQGRGLRGSPLETIQRSHI